MFPLLKRYIKFEKNDKKVNKGGYNLFEKLFSSINEKILKI